MRQIEYLPGIELTQKATKGNKSWTFLSYIPGLKTEFHISCSNLPKTILDFAKLCNLPDFLPQPSNFLHGYICHIRDILQLWLETHLTFFLATCNTYFFCYLQHIHIFFGYLQHIYFFCYLHHTRYLDIIKGGHYMVHISWGILSQDSSWNMYPDKVSIKNIYIQKVSFQ